VGVGVGDGVGLGVGDGLGVGLAVGVGVGVGVASSSCVTTTLSNQTCELGTPPALACNPAVKFVKFGGWSFTVLLRVLSI